MPLRMPTEKRGYNMLCPYGLTNNLTLCHREPALYRNGGDPGTSLTRVNLPTKRHGGPARRVTLRQTQRPKLTLRQAQRSADQRGPHNNMYSPLKVALDVTDREHGVELALL